jgi:dihydrofolate synthase/folylpolyglutamate synthase
VPYPPFSTRAPGIPPVLFEDPLDYLFNLETLGMKFGLDNIRQILSACGSPQEAFDSVVIAGTNGKGSVTAMVEGALRAAGLRVARFTSPHLVRLEERFFVDGAPVDTDTMRALAGRVRLVVSDLLERGALPSQPTFFEATTAMACELFRNRNVEVAVFEVGLGGRLDSTNVVSPVATAITSIDLDHQAFLGSTLAEIAYEKAGIIKPGVPVVLGDAGEETTAVVERVCREQGAPLVHAHEGVDMRVTPRSDGWLSLDLTTPTRSYGSLTLGLRGRHQARNAVTAVRLLEQLDVVVPEAAIAAGLEKVAWPGRLDLVQVSPQLSLLLDSAHNPSGAAALAAYLAEFHRARLPIVFGAMQDKDAEGMLRVLRPQASAFVLTAPDMARAASADGLLALAARVAPDVPTHLAASPAAALQCAWAHAPLVCVTGSIFLVGEILDLTAHGLT